MSTAAMFEDEVLALLALRVARTLVPAAEDEPASPSMGPVWEKTHERFIDRQPR